MNFKKNKKLQVFVWIHGGALLSFSSSPDQFGPEYLMDNGEVILVTLNYRLGLFGFLCSGDAAVKGNFGLKDQQLALKWIATNIEYFGGDQKSITLAGQSSGAASINLHMMNLVSQNLFHRVILQSGTAISPFTYQIDFEAQFRQAAEGSGLENWQTASTFELAYQLKQVNALTLVLAIDQLFAYIATPPVPLRPCIEGDWEGAFLREDPRKVWAEGRFVQKPILIGTNSNEGALGAILTTNATYLRGFNDNIYEFLPSQFDFHPRYAAEVMKFYFGEKDYIDDTNAKDYYRMYTDRLFTYPLITLVQQYLNYADTQENPIFLYEFSFKSSYTLLRTLTGLDINLGVAHNDELFYLFTMKEFIPEFDTTSPEGRMVDIFVRTMVNFAARGEIKDWRRFKPCTPATSTPSCDRQLFLRFKKEDPNQVMVSVTNEIDTEMIKLWSRIDNGINAIELNCN
ncbi:cholinesterase 1-like [Lutzomyia longipalpis]|uniref:cholinesterase 1-like n=1 Tax=Lutzomyia longipalpis TaxID=7200 RepID=UPI00248386DE|nr:cholinesterase 1-like [Lutzomyia longipalpis]